MKKFIIICIGIFIIGMGFQYMIHKLFFPVEKINIIDSTEIKATIRNKLIDEKILQQDCTIARLNKSINIFQTQLIQSDENTKKEFIKPKNKTTEFLNHWFDSANRASNIK